MFAMNKRPKLKITFTPFEIIIQGISVLGIVIIVLTLFIFWSHIPDRIPTHFGQSGKADAWGGKGSLLLLPVFASIIYIILLVAESFPHTYNYLCKITEQNAEFQYRNARMLIGCMKLIIIYLLVYIEWKLVQVALNKAEGLGIGFLPVFIIILFGTIGFFIFRMLKHDKA